MAITFQCSCGQYLSTGPEMVGRQIACPHCRAVMVVPGASIPPAATPLPAAAPAPALAPGPRRGFPVKLVLIVVCVLAATAAGGYLLALLIFGRGG